MKSPHEIALAIARLIRDSLYVDDGGPKPCLGNTLSPQWVAARANNIATAIVGNYDVREAAVSGEIDTDDASGREVQRPAWLTCAPHWIDCGEPVPASEIRDGVAVCDACARQFDKRKEG